MKIEKLGLVNYSEAESLQLKRVEEVASGGEETLLLCSHPPCVTLGRSTQPSDLAGWTGEVHRVSRGGRATYHGPGQLVVYPILDLNNEKKELRSRDLHQYLHLLSDVTCRVLQQHYDLPAMSRPATPELFGDDGLYFTGVWLGNEKLGSIGIAVKKWVTYHGLALNLYADEKAFTGLVPCGFQNNVMTNLEAKLGYGVDRNLFEDQWAQEFMARLY
jgi:lipoyl(octanoyl) transferase